MLNRAIFFLLLLALNNYTVSSLPHYLPPPIKSLQTDQDKTNLSQLELIKPGELRLYFDIDLQKELINRIGKLGLWGPIRQRILGISFVDLSNPKKIKSAYLNGSELFYAASLPKLIILWGLFKKIDLGELKLTRDLYEAANKMIRFSSNDDASFLYHVVGPSYLLKLLLGPPYSFYDFKKGGIWIGKEYGKGAALYRDPIGNHAHAGTANEFARFLLLYDSNLLVSKTVKPLMDETLKNPGLNHKFVRGLASYSPNAILYRKSGSWGDLHADAAIVVDGPKKYIAVAWMKHVQGYLWLEDIIKVLHDLAGRELLQQSTQN